jgi:hypothetical protein
MSESGVTSPPVDAVADSERILLLEFRLENACSALEEARADADRLRSSLAQSAAREADHARRFSIVHQELAEARAEIASLHERLGRSDALRAELEGHLFEAGARADAREIVRLRRELLTHRHRTLTSEETAARLRARVDELLMSRETLLTRVAEWQRLVRMDDPGAVDLSEFIAELRRDILSLEQSNVAGERREAALRERLSRAGIDPDAAETDAPESLPDASPNGALPEPKTREPDVPFALSPDATKTFESSLSSSVWATGMPEPEADGFEEAAQDVAASAEDSSAPGPNPDAVVSDSIVESAVAPTAPASKQEPAADPVRSADEGLNAADPAVRAAALERLIRSLEGRPVELTAHLRSGFADADPRVRRRAVLAAATVPRLPIRPLLEPLRGDPDPQVRRVVREVLRHVGG